MEEPTVGTIRLVLKIVEPEVKEFEAVEPIVMGSISLVPKTVEPEAVEPILMGSIQLISDTPHVTEFHLPGQHDQEAHGHPGAGEPSSSEAARGRKTEAKAPRAGTKAANLAARRAEHAAKDKEFHANLEKKLDEEFGEGTTKRIRDAGHDPADYFARDLPEKGAESWTGELKPSAKPHPGTDSWRDAHGIDKAVWDERPMKRFTGSNDPTIDQLYEGADAQNIRFAKHTVARQSDGIIMVRKPYPGAEKDGFGYIPPQIRPDNPVVVNGLERGKKQGALDRAKLGAETRAAWTEDDLIADRTRKFNDAKRELKLLETNKFSPEEVSRPHNVRENKALGDFRKVAKASGDPKVEAALTQFDKAKKGGDGESIRKAENKLNKAIKDNGDEGLGAAKQKYNEAHFIAKEARSRAFDLKNDPELSFGLARERVEDAKEGLDIAKANPKETLKLVQEYSEELAAKKQGSFDKTRIKYAFPPGEGSAKRIEVNSDPQNIKNLTQGKGRVYFAMEGNIKADSALSQIKKEDPSAAVISVPSVTLWNEKEIESVSKRYLQGRDVILIPDADGAFNDDVSKQAKQLKGALIGTGVKKVYVAAPPTLESRNPETGRWGRATDAIKFPTADPKDSRLVHHDSDPKSIDGRKGLDDHIGLGKGTLGDLVFNDTPDPKFDLTSLRNERKRAGQYVPNKTAMKTVTPLLNAISDLGGENGVARISKNALTKYTGLPESTVGDNLDRLEKMGLVKIHRIFDNKAQGKQRKRLLIKDLKELRRITRLAGVGMPDIEGKFFDKEQYNESAPIYEILSPDHITRPGPERRLASKFKKLRLSGASRVVRTREGAARYGVSIGQPIPAGEPLPSTVLSTRLNVNTSISNGYIELKQRSEE